MIDFLDVSERIKGILQYKLKKHKIYDRDIAAELGLTPQYYAVIKKRKKIPYEAIALFCQQYRVSINWILLEQAPQYLNNDRKETSFE